MAQLTLEFIDEVQTAVDAQLQPMYLSSDFKGIINHCITNIENLTSSAQQSLQSNLERYLYAIHLLQLQISHRHLKVDEIERLFKIGETSLYFCGVRDGSQLGYLFEELHSCRSHLLFLDNKPLAAQWYMALGKRHLPPDQFWIHSAINEVMTVFHSGYAQEAAEAFERLQEYAIDAEQAVFLEVNAIKALRLSGDLPAARTHLRRLSSDGRLAPQMKQVLRWELMWIDFVDNGDIKPFEMAVSVGKEYPDEPHLSIIYLLFHCHSSSTRLMKKLPAIATIRKRYPRQLTSADKLLFEIFELLETLQSAEVPLGVRLAKVGPVLDSISILHAEYQALIFLALARWASRVRQKRFTSILLKNYQAICARMSGYRTDDVFNMMTDLREHSKLLDTVYEVMGQRSSSKTHVQARTIGRSIKILKHVAKLNWELFRTDKSSFTDIKRLIVDQIRDAAKNSVSIRGPYAKSLQFMTVAMATVLDIWDEVHNDIQHIYRTSPPGGDIDFAKSFADAFGREASDVFSSWDKVPIGVGSISQVFRAVLKTGETVALKIKYEKIDELARQDFAMVKFLFNQRRIGKYFNANMLGNLERRFYEELDFEREQSFLMKLHERFKDDPRIFVPRPYPEFCSSGIITMEYCEGEDLDHFLSHATAEEINHVGSAFFDFFYRALLFDRLMKVDSFARNFKVGHGGKLYVLDFGRMYELTEERREEYRNMLYTRVFHPEDYTLDLIPVSLEPKNFDHDFKQMASDLFSVIDSAEPSLYSRDLTEFGKKAFDVFNSSRLVFDNMAEHHYPELETWAGYIYFMWTLKPFANWRQLAINVHHDLALAEGREPPPSS